MIGEQIPPRFPRVGSKDRRSPKDHGRSRRGMKQIFHDTLHFTISRLGGSGRPRGHFAGFRPAL